MALKLYNPAISIGTKVEVFLRFTKQEVEIVRIKKEQLKSEEYLKKHPLGKVPTLQTPEGCIFESNSILRYLARKAGKFYGESPAETASIDQWLEFFNSQIMPSLGTIYYALFGYASFTKEKYDGARKQLFESLKIVDSYLKENAYLGSKQISIADIAAASILRSVFRLIFDQKNRKYLANVTKWFEAVSNTKEFNEHFGKLWLCQKELVPEFIGGQKKEQKKQEKPKAQKKKEQPKKKEEPKKKEDKKKKKSDDEEEEQTHQEKKQANPLDLLPKSPFNLDDFKREFCNSADRAASLKTLWEKFDHDGWSIWKTHYIRYEGEGQVGYLTNNLKNGYLRNLDTFRKYTFAVLGVYGVEGDYEIDGAWLWRGVQIPLEWKEHQSYEYFTFKRLNQNDENDQNLCASYWLNLNPGDLVEGKPVFDAKLFK